jgi:DUF4097 and DUF4098 domain-containing protein YvlB
MKSIVLKRSFSLAAIFVLALFAISCTHAMSMGRTEDTLTRSFNVSEGGTLRMDVDGASVEIDTAGGNTVDVKVILKAHTSSKSKAKDIFDDYKIDFDHSGKNVTIESDYDRGRKLFSWGRRLSVRFIVTVPSKYNLDVKTSGGSISVSEIEGEIKVKTSGGSLKMDAVKGTVYGRTSGGSITLEGCTGDADVKTSGGSIRIGKVDGEVKAITSGGSIKVKEVKGTINAKTSGGSVTAYISEQPEGDCSLTTSGGSVSAHLAENIKVYVDAKTSGGRARSDFSIDGEKSKRKIRGKINGGGPELYLRTSGGSVKIYKID